MGKTKDKLKRLLAEPAVSFVLSELLKIIPFFALAFLSRERPKAESAKHALLAKKVIAGVLTACGAKGAGILLLNRDTQPSRSFQSVQTPNIMLEKSSLKGIRIPKPEPEPVRKSTGPLVSLKHLGEDRESGRIVIRAGGNIDDDKT